MRCFCTQAHVSSLSGRLVHVLRCGTFNSAAIYERPDNDGKEYPVGVDPWLGTPAAILIRGTGKPVSVCRRRSASNGCYSAAFDPFPAPRHRRGRRAKDPCRHAKEHPEIWLMEFLMQPEKRYAPNLSILLTYSLIRSALHCHRNS